MSRCCALISLAGIAIATCLATLTPVVGLTGGSCFARSSALAKHDPPLLYSRDVAGHGVVSLADLYPQTFLILAIGVGAVEGELIQLLQSVVTATATTTSGIEVWPSVVISGTATTTGELEDLPTNPAIGTARAQLSSAWVEADLRAISTLSGDFETWDLAIASGSAAGDLAATMAGTATGSAICEIERNTLESDIEGHWALADCVGDLANPLPPIGFGSLLGDLAAGVEAAANGAASSTGDFLWIEGSVFADCLATADLEWILVGVALGFGQAEVDLSECLVICGALPREVADRVVSFGSLEV